MKATRAAWSGVSCASNFCNSSGGKNRVRGLYSGANPIGSTSAGSPRHSPRRRAILSEARRVTNSFAMVLSEAPSERRFETYSSTRRAPPRSEKHLALAHQQFDEAPPEGYVVAVADFTERIAEGRRGSEIGGSVEMLQELPQDDLEAGPKTFDIQSGHTKHDRPVAGDPLVEQRRKDMAAYELQGFFCQRLIAVGQVGKEEIAEVD